jgi:hypothetical protein
MIQVCFSVIFLKLFLDDWSIVLWIHGLILNGTNIFFCVFASAKPARWTLDTTRGPKLAARRKQGQQQEWAKKGKQK